MRILIQNGEVVTASDQFKAEVLIEGEKVVAVGQNLGVTNADKVYDATGHLVIPGGIDVHCHLDMPFMGTRSKDDFFTGTRAAISGGTTSIIEFCIPTKGGTIKQALADWDAKSAPKACCDYSFHMAIVDWNEGIRKELDAVFERGITSFKVFTAYKGALMLSDEEIFRLMLEVKARGGLVTAHAVNGDVLTVLADKFAAEGKLTPHYHPLCQPGYAEGEATGRILELGNLAGQPAYIVHMTAKEAVEELVRARARGWESFGEVCTQHLTLDDSLYDLPDFEGAKYVMSPPLRKKADQEALWAALANGTIQVVGTDHCTFDFKGGKDMGKDDFRKIPNGLNGIEERMNMLFSYGVKSGKIPMTRFVEVTATNPAKIFGLYPQKGHISPGADADVVIYNPNKEGVISAKTHNSACDYNVYEGWKILGAPHTVFVRGKVAYENGKFVGEAGNGKFLARAAGKPQLAMV
ncbi:MAG: D-hydantoinase [Candidatus Xenobia bacterium]